MSAVAARPVGAQRPPPGPDPLRLAAAVARAYLEVEAGRRSPAQLTPLLEPKLRTRLFAEPLRPGPGPAGDAILAVRGEQPTPDALDAAVVVRRGERVGVLAIRVERFRDGWRVVELARPEDVCGRSLDVAR